MRRNVFKLLILWGLCFNAFALSSSPSVFYPLPIQAQGKFLAAQNLFIGDNGGVWVHDVHGKVLFYDGRTLLPRKGSLLDFPAEKLGFVNNTFWTYFDNEVYENTPGLGRTLAFSLSPGAEITNLGSSGDYIWVTDGTNFYTFHTKTKQFDTYSLLELYQHNKSSQIDINDAQVVLTKWVLATSSGVYLSSEGNFSHISASGKHYVEKLYFSKSRRELVIGTLNGAVVIDITNPNGIVKRIGRSHVLALAETSTEYWIGTEHGLYTYNFLSGNDEKIAKNPYEDFSLPGEKIYSLRSDGAGGIWIATSNGIRYFSLFSKTFSRKPIYGQGIHSSDVVITKVKALDTEGYWASSTSGLYYISHGDDSPPKQLYAGAVSDFLIVDDKLWLATEEGLICIDRYSSESRILPVPREIQNLAIQHLALTDSHVVWLTSGETLYSFDINNHTVKNYGSTWLVEKYLPTKITEIEATPDSGVLIGTDHGYYSFVGEKISFNRASERFGKTVDIAIDQLGTQWFASSYGLYRVAQGGRDVQEVPLIEDNISPQCLMPSEDGMWLGSSKGLSYYDMAGQLRKHFGAPFGLITNEFTSGSCSSLFDSDLGSIIFLGSKYGVLSAVSADLLVASTPQSRALFSRVTVDQNTVSLGGGNQVLSPFKYGASVTFKLGIVPVASTQELEYRLNATDSWSVFEGGLLTLDHLLPGDYVLQVRSMKYPDLNFIGAEQRFSVAKPWYLTNWAAVTFIFGTIGMITIIVLWRSRFMALANRQLKAQVALKTDQLRHQSRILLTTNQQLRKQLQVKNALVEHKSEELVGDVAMLLHTVPDWQQGQASSAVINLQTGLDQLKNSRNDGQLGEHCYDILFVLNSVFTVWREELSKSDIELDIKVLTNQHFVRVSYFNLDVVFNSFIANVLKRSFRSQKLTVILEEFEDDLSITFLDHGSPLPKHLSSGSDQVHNASVDLNIDKLPLLMQQSGGDLKIFISDTQNKVQLTWPLERQMEVKAIDAVGERVESLEVLDVKTSPIQLSAEEEWMNKVRLLIAEHYADPDFGTSVAAKQLYVSERSLQRRFKSMTSRTFKDYLNEVRLEKACERLLSGAKISDVAFDCGFNDPSYFSQRFKHHFGVSPSKFVETAES
ncbi:helix-turn-helix domain-containing protein [Vibrio sp. T187]|uniref:AraC family transcriptional regulator n=1 Tax=Vibrio TaxID=662 RepID=UPI0010C9FF79|nr:MULTISPECIES: helix-turn-helix domain-containing protein [Vibrio]MBW3694467.1 helix-turn-helix domain-containing protein [Vibrio sp. T187]